MLFKVLVWPLCLSLLSCPSDGTVLEVARLQPDRVLDVEVPFNASLNATNGSLVELMEEILPLDVVEIVLNMSVPGEVKMVETSWGFNWSEASVLNTRQARTPVGIFLDHFQLQVQGIDALNVTIASNASSNETEPLLMVYCTNSSTTFNCFFLVDIEVLLPNGTADNETFIQISVPFLANFEPWEEVQFLFSTLAYDEDNYTASVADVVMALLAVRPVLELTAGEPPSPGCPGDAVYLNTLVEHDINTSVVDAFSIQLLSRSGSFHLFTTMSPRQITLLEIAENATIPVGIILPYITAGQHEPIIFIRYRDDSRGNSYRASDTTFVWIESYAVWDYRVQSSFVETSAEEVTVYEYFQLKAYVNTPDTNDTLVTVRTCAKYPYSLSSGQLPVSILGVTLVQDAVEGAVAITDTLLDPSVGCWQGAPPLPPQNCTCWDVAPFTVPQMYLHTPFLLFTLRVAGHATQGERVTFTMSLTDNLTNGSCTVPSYAEQEIDVVEPAIMTIKSIVLTDVGVMEPPTAQVNISVRHAVSSRSAAINVTVVDELPEGFTLVGEEVSDLTRVQVTMTARTITFLLNETLLLGESVTLSYWGTLDDQYFIAHSGVEQLLTTTTDYTGVEHNAAALFSTWNFDHSAKLYSHTQNNHCIRITAYPQPMFSRLAVGWAATSGGGAGLAIFVICGLVYLKKKRLACCGQYSGVAPEGKEEDEIVGYTELEVNSCVRPMEYRQDPEGENTDTAPSPPLNERKEDGSEFFRLGVELSYTDLLLQVEGAGYIVDRFTRLLAVELATIDREHANLMLTAYVAIATNCLSELQLPAGEKKEVAKRLSRQCALIVDSLAEQGHDGWEQSVQLTMEAIASEVTSLKHRSEDWLQKISSALGGVGDEMQKASVDEWNRMEESRMTALKEAQLTAAQREQCMKEMVAIFEAIQTVKQLFMSLLMEADGPDSTQKGETAIRAIDWITLVGRHLNQTRAELQVGAVEHFARVAKFQAEVDHLADLGTAQVDNFLKHIRKAARALVKNDILEKEDASGMVEKATEKWPQPENKSTHIQQQMKSVEKRKTGSARGREKVLIEELARAKTSDTLVEKLTSHWRALRREDITREEAEQKATEQLKWARLEVHKDVKALLLDRKMSFSTKLLLRGVHANQTRKLEDMYKSGEKEVLQEAEGRKMKREEELSQRLSHIKQQMAREQEHWRVSLNYQMKEWTKEVNKTYNLRPHTAHSGGSGGNSPLPEEQEQVHSGVSLASSLMAELEVVWKEWKEVLKQKTLWFEGEVLNALQQDGAERKKELTKAFQGLKEYQVKEKVQDRRRAAEKETASSIQNELEMTKCKLEGNVTRLAMENARQILQLQEQQNSHEKLQYELLAEMLNKHKPPQEEVEGVIQQYNDDCQTLMQKLESEKHRQMEAVRAKVEERRLRKERAASKSPASMSLTFSQEKQPRLKQLIIKYRWEIKMESIRQEYQERLKLVTENTTRHHELKLLEAMNALDNRLTENFAKLGHIPMSNLKVRMEQKRSSMPLSGQGIGGKLPPLKEEEHPGAGLGAGPSRASAPWQLNPEALPALPGKNNKLPSLHITLSQPQQHS